MGLLGAAAGLPWGFRKGGGYLLAGGLVALVTAGIGLIPSSLGPEHRFPLYLIAVLFTGAFCGRGPALAAAGLSFFAFNWFFVDPVHTLHVADAQQWQSLLLFVLAAVVTGHLAALLRERADVASRREREASLLYEVGKALAGTGPVEAGLQTAAERLRQGLALSSCDVLLEEEGRLRPLRGPGLERDDQAVALWVLTHAAPAGRGVGGGGRGVKPARWVGGGEASRLAGRGRGEGSHRLGRLSPGARRGAGVAFLPLTVEGKVVGVLHAVREANGARGPQGQVAPLREARLLESRLLESACGQLALAVERGRLQRLMVQAEVRERTDAQRTALLSSVSHDLRSPLAAIKAAAGSLLQRDVSWDGASRDAFATQIERQADRLDRLVGNLLDLSRIEGGALVLDKQWYPLRELVEDTVARLDPLLVGHRVEVAVPEGLPPLLADYVLLQQVLVNLIENAARYAPQGTRIRVSATAYSTQAPAATGVRIRVQDEGPGLPLSERGRIFEPFYRLYRPAGLPAQGRNGAPAAPRGTGLGLTVCAGFVAAHGGRIWVEEANWGAPSGAHGGAAFVFELPQPGRPLVVPPEAPLAALPAGREA